MSHIVRIQTEVRDAAAVADACTRLGLAPPEQGTFQLYSGGATGLAVRLPGWRYPLVCRADVGELAYDNFQGAWGDAAQLNRFLQAYALEKARLEASRQGHSITEQPLANGSVKLTIHVRASA
jgi:hypothetical protein